MFQIFRINKINFEQNPKLHKHPDTLIKNVILQPRRIIRLFDPKPFLKNPSNRMRTPLEKKNLVHYLPSDDNDFTDDELQKDPPEAFLDQNSPYKTFTYIAF